MSIPARNANISAQRRFSLDVAHLLETPLKAMQPCLAYRIDDWQYVQKLADLRCSLTALPIDALEQGFCHGDMHGGNAHFTDDNIVTCFDFDCCGWGWRTYDVAVFRWGANCERKKRNNGTRFCGDIDERHLNEVDWQAVPLFMYPPLMVYGPACWEWARLEVWMNQ